MKYLFVIGFIIFFFGCTSSKKDQTLSLAGENRPELEKVLSHYEKGSLKHQAAVFLVENMTYHYAQESDELREKIALHYREGQRVKAERPNYTVYTSANTAHDSLKKTANSLARIRYERKQDAQTLTADYLIRNIDQAFEVWEKVPWREGITFEQFCRTILPYRISDEAVSDWRQRYFKTFSFVLDSLPETPYSYITACQWLYDALIERDWYHVDDPATPYVDAITLLENRFGSCRDKAALTLYAMRALCIPGSLDIFVQHCNKMYPYHYWNQIPGPDGKPIEVLIFDDHLRPLIGSTDSIRKRGIIYRLNYGMQQEEFTARNLQRELPPRLRDVFLSNVTNEYYPDHNAHLEIPVRGQKEKMIYLSVFNNRDWIPIVGTEIKHGKAQFQGVEPEIVYRPVFYRDKRTTPSTAPFLMKKDGTMHFFDPDTTQTEEIILLRKHPLRSALQLLIRKALSGGRFEGANRADFSDAITLHTVEEDLTLQITQIQVHTPQPFRYIRYVSPDESFCNMAELAFYGLGERLPGTIIGTEGTRHTDPAYAKQAVFDRDPLTYYLAKEESGAWVGLDFGRPQQLTTIEYQFRNDDNLIRQGEDYELFYFTKEGMQSLGRKTATSQYLLYENAPANALFWLRNHTKGQEERIFSYENGKQIWW